MLITNKAKGARGFFHDDNPITSVQIQPGQTMEVKGFNPLLPSHAAMLESGEISVPSSDMRRFNEENDKRRVAEEKAEADRLKLIAADEKAAAEQAEKDRLAAEKAAKSGQAPPA